MRSWFRVHLLTGVVMMLVMAALLGANFQPRRGGLAELFTYYKSYDHTEGVHSIVGAHHYSFGWPFPAQRVQPNDWVFAPISEKPPGFRMRQVYEAAALQSFIEAKRQSFPIEWCETYKEKNVERIWYGKFVALNAAVALVIVLLSGFLCEAFSRRRDRTQKLS